MGACSLKTSLPELGVVPAFELTSESGEPFRSAALTGKVWVANFIFTTCHGPCPRMSSQMRHLQNKLAGTEDVHLLSFTVDPANDTPPALAAYARQFGADPARWTFLTGDKTGLERLSYDTFHLNRVGGPQFEHSGRFVLVDRRSRIRGYYDSSDPEAMAQLRDDIRALLKEVL
jgi:protein SCO1/2